MEKSLLSSGSICFLSRSAFLLTLSVSSWLITAVNPTDLCFSLPKVVPKSTVVVSLLLLPNSFFSSFRDLLIGRWATIISPRILSKDSIILVFIKYSWFLRQGPCKNSIMVSKQDKKRS